MLGVDVANWRLPVEFAFSPTSGRGQIEVRESHAQVAQGQALHGPEMNLPLQDRMPLYGYALQCRITTEDPQNNFVPDYGKIHTYRSPAGFGIRLDGGSASRG